jgi:hypothetical protein
MTIRRQQLEARVIQIVDLVLAGGRVEDDLVECKAAWPDPGKRQIARQLAGHANGARGEPILWLIGLDEKAHSLTHSEPVEVASWWSSVAKWFDGAIPDLTDVVVHVGERRAVRALYFTTDLAPYLITGGGETGALEREVPIRDGTRTRSARRDELLRLLIPAVASPAAHVLSATVQISRGSAIAGRPPYMEVWLNAKVFFEQPGTPSGVVTLPRHMMRGRIDFTGSGLDPVLLSLGYHDSPGLPRPGIPMMGPRDNAPIVVASGPVVHGVERRPDAVVVTGPDALEVRSSTTLDGDLLSLFPQDVPVEVRLSFGVAGIDRRVQLEVQLDPEADEDNKLRRAWKLDVADDDPWQIIES